MTNLYQHVLKPLGLRTCRLLTETQLFYKNALEMTHFAFLPYDHVKSNYIKKTIKWRNEWRIEWMNKWMNKYINVGIYRILPGSWCWVILFFINPQSFSLLSLWRPSPSWKPLPQRIPGSWPSTFWEYIERRTQ